MLGQCLSNVRACAPLVHCITNYVTANDCANILLACGASPIMADDEGEVEDIAAKCGALVLNLGTLHQSTLPAMLKAGKAARACGHPIVLDPVGAGASRVRTASALHILAEVRPNIIRGNISELKALASGTEGDFGVDAAPADRVTDANIAQAEAFIKGFARKTGAVIAVTGSIDIVADGSKACVIRNGHPMMAKVTGTGCQLSALAGAFAAANSEDLFVAAAAAVCAMGLAGQIAAARLEPAGGNGSYRNYILDAVTNMDAAALEQGANYEMR